jgi:glutamyl/glutaminyl-tRNA synthetase
VFDLPEYAAELLIWKKSTAAEVKEILPKLSEFLDNFSAEEWHKAGLEAKVGEWIKNSGYNNGQVLWPLRVAVSGQEKSPGPFEIAEVLGKDETLVRLGAAINKLTISI